MKFIHIMDKEYRHMKKLGYTQESIGNILGWDQSKVSHVFGKDIRDGFAKLTVREVYALLEVFGHDKKSALNILVYIDKLRVLLDGFNR